jgi:hypothetical protein
VLESYAFIPDADDIVLDVLVAHARAVYTVVSNVPARQFDGGCLVSSILSAGVYVSIFICICVCISVLPEAVPEMCTFF